MARKPRWWHVLQSAKNEVRLAVDLYNRSGRERQLEAFIVHMSMGWLKLLQAHFEQAGKDLYVRDSRGWRIRHEDGGFKHRSLKSLSDEYFASNDPVKANLEFFTGLRNQIEHRYENDIAALVAGRTQAFVLNYEKTLVACFGDGEGLAEELRFPIFLSSITADALESVRKVRARVPQGVLEWVQDFDTGVESRITSDQQFDFRIYLIPYTGSKTDADAAITFVKAEDLTAEQNTLLDQVRTIIREKKVPVADLDALLPKQVVTQVNRQLGREFTMHMHTQAWHYFDVRPPTDSENRCNTKSQFCVYNHLFGKYVYTDAWVKYLVRKLSDDDIYDAVAAVKV